MDNTDDDVGDGDDEVPLLNNQANKLNLLAKVRQLQSQHLSTWTCFQVPKKKLNVNFDEKENKKKIAIQVIFKIQT